MRAIIQALKNLFRVAERVSVGTGRGLLQHGAGKYGVNAIRKLDITVRGVRIAYRDLHEADQAMVDEVVEYTTRFAFQYIDHHDEHTRYRIQPASLEDVVKSHAAEIFEAASGALNSRVRSHMYDSVAGKPTRTAIFMDEDIMKQLITAVIAEVCSHIEIEDESVS